MRFPVTRSRTAQNAPAANKAQPISAAMPLGPKVSVTPSSFTLCELDANSRSDMSSGRLKGALGHEHLVATELSGPPTLVRREPSSTIAVHQAYGSTVMRGANCAASSPPTGVPCGVSSHACAPNASAAPSLTPIVIRLRRLWRADTTIAAVA